MNARKHLNNDEIEKAVQSFDSRSHELLDSFPILIIDDDKWIHRVVAHYLRSWGFKPESAMDAVEGISKAIKHRPLVILLDIIMPEVSGDVLLRMLKNVELTANIPVIVISGNLSKEILGKTYKEGAVGYISKPITQDALYGKLKDCLGPTVFREIVKD